MKNSIAAALKRKGKSQGWLAQAAGVDKPNLCRIVNGKTKNPSARTAIKIAQALGMTVEDLWKS